MHKRHPLERRDRDRRTEPDALTDRSLRLSREDRPGGNAGAATQRRLVERKRLQGDTRRRSRLRHVVKESWDRRSPALIVEPAEQADHRTGGVGNRPAEHPAVDRASQRAHGHVHDDEAAQARRERRDPRVEVGRIRENQDVRLEPVGVMIQEAREVRRSDLLLPLNEQTHVHG